MTVVSPFSVFGNQIGEECLRILEAHVPGWQPLEGSGEPERWTFDGQDQATYYDQDFAELYSKGGETSLSVILKNRKQQGRKNNVLDLFGSGFFVEDQNSADSITGVRFGPFSKETNDNNIKSLIARLPPTPTEILGDVMNPKTWEALRFSMKNRGITSMDLVAMRPMGGWRNLPVTNTANQNALALSFIIENVLALLSPDGQFYFSVDVPHLREDLRTNKLIQKLVKRIEDETNFHLVLTMKLSKANTTYRLAGVLYPKKPKSLFYTP